MKLRAIAFITVLLVSVSAFSADTDRKYITSSAPGASSLPFSDGVLVGNTLYIAGHLGLDKTGKPPAAVTDEVKNALDGIKSVLEGEGMTMDDLVSVQVFCSDVSLFSQFNGVYRTYFHDHFPARAFLGSGTLLFGAHFEVMGIAVKRAK